MIIKQGMDLKTPKCLNCNKENAVKQVPFGWTVGLKCQTKHKKYGELGEAAELVPEEMREERKEYAKDILQRYKGDGIPSKEYIKAYGDKGFTKEEVKRAKNVWSDLKYYKEE